MELFFTSLSIKRNLKRVEPDGAAVEFGVEAVFLLVVGEELVDVGLGGADELGELPLVFGAMGDDEAGKFIHWHKFIVGAATGDLLLFAVIWVALVEDVAEAGLGVGELFVEGDELFVVGKVFFDADVIADAEAFELACEIELDDLDAAAFCVVDEGFVLGHGRPPFSWASFMATKSMKRAMSSMAWSEKVLPSKWAAMVSGMPPWPPLALRSWNLFLTAVLP